MYKRQLNSFLTDLGIKQLFWSNVRRRCQRNQQDYKEVVEFLCTNKFDAIVGAFLWDPKEYPNKPGLYWNLVNRLWQEYCRKHHFC